MNKKDTLIEIYTEEFPAQFLFSFIHQVKNLLPKILSDYKIEFKKFDVYVTPVRLVIYIEEVVPITKEEIIEIIGPNIDIGIKNGEFTESAIGFAKKYNVELKDLFVKETEKGKYLTIKKQTGGKETSKILPEIVTELLTNLTFPKKMYWEESKFQFPRPIRNILIFFGDTNIKFTFCGIKSSDTTFGIKSYPIKKIKIKGKGNRSAAERYFSILEDECIIVDQNKRLNILKKMLDNLTSKKKLKYDEDEKLLNEINFIIEYPSCVLCNFDKEFLSLPKEFILTCIKSKQKFIPVFDLNGNITTLFIGIKNGYSEYLDKVKKGYEKVLHARLNDVKFFYETDLKTDFISRVELLKGIIYNAQLNSTYYDKILRIESLTKFLNKMYKFNFSEDIISKTARCIKNDITTHIVYEYPELQGIAGKIYCLAQNVEKEIAIVCENHYKPKDFDDTLPEDNLSILFSLSEKISDILDNVLINNLPTGTSDPFGLKRTADGLIKLLLQRQLDLSVEQIINYYIENSTSDLEKLKISFQDIVQNTINFLRQRFETILLSQEYKIDETRTVLANFSGDVYTKSLIIEVLKNYRENKSEDFNLIIEMYKRVNNIMRQGYTKFKPEVSKIATEIDETLLQHEIEKQIVQEIKLILQKIETLSSQNEYNEIFSILVQFKPSVDTFFDKVLIFDENKDIAINRLRIVNKIIKILNVIGHLEYIQQQ